MRVKLLGIPENTELPQGFESVANNYEVLLWHSGAFNQEVTKKIVLMNSAINTDVIFNDVCLITYGINPKATITASSISRNNMLICLQRSIINAYDEIIEPHEFQTKISSIENVELTLAMCSLSLLKVRQKNL